MELKNHRYTTDQELLEFVQDLQQLSYNSLFIQVFSGVMQRDILQNVLDILHQNLPQAQIIGATSAGEIVQGHMELSSIIISASLFEATDVNTYYYPSSNYSDGVQAAQEVISERTKACILFNEGYKSDSELFLDGFSSVSRDVMIAGGNASDDLSFEKSYVLHGNTIYEEGIVIASLQSDILRVKNAYSFSWTPIGRQMKITHAQDNTVYEIDNRPIKEIYKKYLGTETIEKLPLSAVEFPLVKEEDTIPIARSLIGIDPHGGFTFAGHFNNGDEVRFAIGNTEEILTQSFEIQKEIESSNIEATYVYSCVVRRLYLQDQINYELGLINDVAPSAGFFTYGEFFHSERDNKLLNITTTTLSLSEAQKDLKTPVKKSNYTRRHSMLRSLTHLLNVTQNDYDHNLAELKIQKKTIAKQLLDETTHIKNRTALFSDLKKMKSSVTLMLININHFSDINNYYGHKAGDHFLEKFAYKLQEFFGYETIYRIGGDEFAVVCQSKLNLQAKEEDFLNLLTQLETEQFHIDTHEISINISAGLASSGPKMVYSLAHIALKEARVQREKLVIFNKHSSLRAKIQNNIHTVKKIKSAIKEDRILPFYQGIVNSNTKQIAKYESLIRLIDEDGTILAPHSFLEHAKKAKLYDTLTQIMINKTFETFEDLDDVEFSLNLTLQDIESPQTIALLFDTLKRSKAAKRVVFEVVESERIEDFEEFANFINKVKSYGAKVAIDDFGTGYSNFSYLSKLNIDYIKIDGSLIKNITKDPDHLLTVESILFFAKKKNIATIAEFVEDKESYEKLLELGIDFIQGYLFSVPSAKVKKETLYELY